MLSSVARYLVVAAKWPDGKWRLIRPPSQHKNSQAVEIELKQGTKQFLKIKLSPTEVRNYYTQIR